MRTIRTKIYQFKELSKEAQSRAIETERNNMYGDTWLIDDANKTLEAFCKVFSIDFRNFDYCEMYRSEWSVGIDQDILNLSGLRLSTYIHNNFYKEITQGKYYGRLVDTFANGEKIPISKEYPIGQRHVFRHSKITRVMDNCPLTGMGFDCSVLQPIIDFLKKPSDKTDFEQLLNDCLYSLAHAVSEDIDYQMSDEAIIETIEANEYEFFEDGKLIPLKYAKQD